MRGTDLALLKWRVRARTCKFIFSYFMLVAFNALPTAVLNATEPPNDPNCKKVARGLLPDHRLTIQSGSRSATAHTQIRPDNMGEIFTHQYNPADPNILGAKGLAIYRFDRNQPLFWATGNGRVGNNIHHRDALGFLRAAQAEEMSRIQKFMFWMHENADSFAGPYAPELQKTYEWLLTDQHNYFDVQQQTFSSWAERLRTQRNHLSFEEADLRAAVGFQFSAQNHPRRGPQIFRFEIDSSVTAAATNRFGETVKSGQDSFDDNPFNDWTPLVHSAHEAIDPTLRAYPHITLRGYDRVSSHTRKAIENWTGLRVKPASESP